MNAYQALDYIQTLCRAIEELNKVINQPTMPTVIKGNASRLRQELYEDLRITCNCLTRDVSTEMIDYSEIPF